MSDDASPAEQRWLVDEIAAKCGVSSSAVRRYVVMNHVAVDGQIVNDPGARVAHGDMISFTLPLTGRQGEWLVGQTAPVIWREARGVEALMSRVASLEARLAEAEAAHAALVHEVHEAAAAVCGFADDFTETRDPALWLQAIVKRACPPRPQQ